MVAVGRYSSTCGRDGTCDLRASIELGSVDIFIDKLETASDARPSYAENLALMHACDRGYDEDLGILTRHAVVVV